MSPPKYESCGQLNIWKYFRASDMKMVNTYVATNFSEDPSDEGHHAASQRSEVWPLKTAKQS